MELSGSTRKRADTFAPEELFQTIQLESGKGHMNVPEADTEHVRPSKMKFRGEPALSDASQIKVRLKMSLQTISDCENKITDLIAKIDREKNNISGMIDKI